LWRHAVSDPTQSRIGGLLMPGFTRSDAQVVTPLDAIGRQALPPMVNYVKPRNAFLPSPIKVERDFPGALLLEYAIPAGGSEVAFERLSLRFNTTIYLDEPIANNGFLFLWVPSASLDGKGPGLCAYMIQRTGATRGTRTQRTSATDSRYWFSRRRAA
jgi:hypothetical protein